MLSREVDMIRVHTTCYSLALLVLNMASDVITMTIASQPHRTPSTLPYLRLPLNGSSARQAARFEHSEIGFLGLVRGLSQ